MGIDFHALNFLRYVRHLQDFGDTVTIGRQELHVNNFVLGQLLPLAPDYQQHAFCEALLEGYFGASKVDSLDNSDYENATHIHDMSADLPASLRSSYDTVIDAGCLEHVYNAPQALKNCSQLCRPGGQIIHILPANNYCGHGFWQFSPELFFSLYSENNGYRDTEVFVADFTDKWTWYKVRRPHGGARVNIASLGEVYVMVRTVRADSFFSHAHVQQSDYLYEWEYSSGRPEPRPYLRPAGVRGAIMGVPFLYDRLFPLYHKLQRLFSAERMTARNPGLSRFDVRTIA